MDPNAVILDISSDEEVGWGESRGIVGGDDSDWLTEILGEVERGNDDSDDVVIVGEFLSTNPKKNFKSSFRDLDDDECVILDHDPDKALAVAVQNDGVDDSDELCVVSEKGQVACRDYPHPRHLCIKFPFASSRHEMRCDQCFCYVCDSLAPCVIWGTGSSPIDHCHATDKEEFWRRERKSLKNANKAHPPIPKATVQTNLAPPPSSSPLPTQHQILRPNSILALSMSTHFGIPSFSNLNGSQCSGYVVPKSRFQPNLVSQQLLSAHNGLIQEIQDTIVLNWALNYLEQYLKQRDR